jgi:hypothetical protein
MYSRNGHDFTERFPSIAQLPHELPAKAAVLDGEVVASDADGLRTSPGCMCVGPSRALSTYARSTYLRSMAVIPRPQPLEAPGVPAGAAGACRLPLMAPDPQPVRWTKSR